MGLLFDAATAWNNLSDTAYKIVVSHRGAISEINLAFHADEFTHIAGKHYANDVDFGLHKAEIYRGKFIRAILNKKFDDTIIERSRNWETIKGRLLAVLNLERILDGNFTIARFDSDKVVSRGRITNCNIQAEYVIKDNTTGHTFFLFFDQDSSGYYCKSAFKNETLDYMSNQTRVTVLEKIKITNGLPQLLLRKDSYRANTESTC